MDRVAEAAQLRGLQPARVRPPARGHRQEHDLRPARVLQQVPARDLQRAHGLRPVVVVRRVHRSVHPDARRLAGAARSTEVVAAAAPGLRVPADPTAEAAVVTAGADHVAEEEGAAEEAEDGGKRRTRNFKLKA